MARRIKQEKIILIIQQTKRMEAQKNSSDFSISQPRWFKSKIISILKGLGKNGRKNF